MYNIRYIIIVVLFFICGCINIKPNKISESDVIQQIDVNALKTQEKTYKIVDNQSITVYDNNDIKNLKYNSDWFIVHKDFIKLCNENQNFILDNFKSDSKSHISFITFIKPVIILFIFVFILNIITKLFLLWKKKRLSKS